MGNKVSVIIPAAGSGSRLGYAQPKPFVPLVGHSMISHTLSVFEQVPSITSIILVVQAEWRSHFQAVLNQYSMTKVNALVDGGAERSISVANGLKAVEKDTDIVLVHDAARPLVNHEMIERVIIAARKHGAATLGVPVKPTLKLVDQQGMVEETLDRSRIWEIQTPQAFDKELLIEAHAQGVQATDDASLVERLGKPVAVVMGGYENIKVTTQEDVDMAACYLRKRLNEKN